MADAYMTLPLDINSANPVTSPWFLLRWSSFRKYINKYGIFGFFRCIRFH